MAHEEIDRDLAQFVAFAGDEKVYDRWFVRKLDPPFNALIALALGLCTLFVGTLVYWIVWRFLIYRAHGYLLLTNRRVIYFERGRSPFRTRRFVGTLDIEHVSGCRLFVRNAVVKLLGFIKIRERKEMYLNVFTEHFDAISIGAVKSLRKSWFQPAEDMVAVVHEIGARIHEVQAAAGGAR
jgi:hypothetical protein